MPTKRVPISRPARSRVTAEAAALFWRAVEIESRHDDEFWEEDGGRRREYVELSQRLDRALGLKVWQPSPLDVREGEPPVRDEHHRRDWRAAVELRRALSQVR